MQTSPDIVAVMVGVAVEGPYSYRVPPGMVVTRGSIVAVPLGPRLTLGVVWGAPKDTISHNRLRDISIAYDIPPLSEELLKLVDWVARELFEQNRKDDLTLLGLEVSAPQGKT